MLITSATSVELNATPRLLASSLGVAFNSTLVALVISIVLMFLLHQLQRLQDSLIVSVNDYLQQKVLDRLSKASSG